MEDEEEDPSRLLALFDFYWFHHAVLLSNSHAAPSVPPPDPDPPAAVAVTATAEKELAAPEPPLPRRSSTLRRTLSDEAPLATSSDSSLLVHRARRLYPVLSGKATSEVEEEEEEGDEHREVTARCRPVTEQAPPPRDRKFEPRCSWKGEERRIERGTKSKSLSELEFEELKGFMDLGFTFSDAESDQRLLSIVPGLQRLGRRRASSEQATEVEAGGDTGDASIQRPYLSEAWDAVGLDERSRRSHVYDHLLRNWKVPAAGDAVDMKDHLRSWAHTVASAVR